MEIVDERLGHDFGERHASGDLRAAGNQDGNDESVEASGRAPADGFDERPPVSLGRADESVSVVALGTTIAILAGMRDIDDSHADRVIGFRIDQNEAAGLLVRSVAIEVTEPVELHGDGTNVVGTNIVCGPYLRVSRSTTSKGGSIVA